MLSIAPLKEADVAEIAAAFAKLGWNKPASQYERYLEEAACRVRDTFVARSSGAFAGYVTIKWKSDYGPFREEAVPEIQDFNVLPEFRRQKIGSRLMDEAEATIRSRSSVAGIGVAFDSDYGPAQRLYVLRGYVPDGRGGTSHGASVKWGDTVSVDDDLVLLVECPLSTQSGHSF